MPQLAFTVPVQLTITLNEHGQFNVHGPLDNKLLCYGLLEIAREIVTKHQTSRIVTPDFDVVPVRPQFPPT